MINSKNLSNILKGRVMIIEDISTHIAYCFLNLCVGKYMYLTNWYYEPKFLQLNTDTPLCFQIICGHVIHCI